MPATAQLIRHLIALPGVVVGVAMVAGARSIAGLYGTMFGDLGFRRLRRAYKSPVGTGWIRVAGVACIAASVYWIIVGTG